MPSSFENSRWINIHLASIWILFPNGQIAFKAVSGFTWLMQVVFKHNVLEGIRSEMLVWSMKKIGDRSQTISIVKFSYLFSWESIKFCFMKGN